VDWRASTVIQVEDHLFHGEEKDKQANWYRGNEKGLPMVIPSYHHVYNQQWEKAFFKNPLEVDWSLFNMHSSIDVDYLTSLIEVLQDQRDLWINDCDTNGQPIVVMFDRFIKALKRLLMYCFTLGYVKY
jgi:hypothetical protein